MNSRKCTITWLAALSTLGFVLVAEAAPPSTNPGVGNPNPPGLANRAPQAANPIPPGLANPPPPAIDGPALALELLAGDPPPVTGQFETEPEFDPVHARVTNSIPEPTSVALTTLGLIGIGFWRRRGRSAA